MKKYRFVIYLMLMPGFNSILAQSPCANSLYEANKSFEAGDFSKSASLLKPCLNAGFNKNEKAEGYRLLALDYIYLNEPGKADTAVRNLLIKKHSYKLYPEISDPVSLTNIVATYDVVPLLTGGVNVGFNYTNINLVTNYAPSNTTGTYIPEPGAQFGLQFDYAIWKDLNITAGVQYYSVGYQHTLDSVAGWKEQFTENLKYINIPLSAKYYIYFKHDALIRPYIEAGADFAFLNSTDATIVSTDNSSLNSNQASTNPISRRNALNTSILYGAGLNIRFGEGWFTANVRYMYGLSEIVNGTNRYNDLSLVYNSNYIDDDFKFNNWQFTFGYTFILLYKVQKIRDTRS
jgi:outer membrane protein W